MPEQSNLLKRLLQFTEDHSVQPIVDQLDAKISASLYS